MPRVLLVAAIFVATNWRKDKISCNIGKEIGQVDEYKSGTIQIGQAKKVSKS